MISGNFRCDAIKHTLLDDSRDGMMAFVEKMYADMGYCCERVAVKNLRYPSPDMIVSNKFVTRGVYVNIDFLISSHHDIIAYSALAGRSLTIVEYDSDKQIMNFVHYDKPTSH